MVSTLDNDEEVLHSTNLFEWVSEHKLLEHPDRGDFNFAKVFAKQAHRYNTDREYLLMATFTPSRDLLPEQGEYPLFLHPDQPITIEDVINAFRSDYSNAPIISKFPLPDGQPQRTIPVQRNSEAHIIEIQSDLPSEIKNHYLAVAQLHPL